MHGWQDNAGSFDRLIPLLPKHLSYLALDLPGHGLSSRLPAGIIYSSIQELYTINYIIRQYFKWDQVSILAHSLGAVTAFMYAATFPDRVDMIIALDTLKPAILNAKFVQRFLRGLNEILEADLRNQQGLEPPSYDYEELVEKLYLQTYMAVSREAAPFLLERGSKRSSVHPNKYYFSRDRRLKVFHLTMVTHEICLTMAKSIRCPYLFIKSQESPYEENKQYLRETIELMQKNPKFEYVEVKGAHYVHLTHPERISGNVIDFLNKYRPIKIVNKL